MIARCQCSYQTCEEFYLGLSDYLYDYWLGCTYRVFMWNTTCPGWECFVKKIYQFRNVLENSSESGHILLVCWINLSMTETLKVKRLLHRCCELHGSSPTSIYSFIDIHLSEHLQLMLLIIKVHKMWVVFLSTYSY